MNRKKIVYRSILGLLAVVGLVFAFNTFSSPKVKAETYYYDNDLNNYQFYYQITPFDIYDWGDPFEFVGSYHVFIVANLSVTNTHTDKYSLKFNGITTSSILYIGQEYHSSYYSITFNESTSTSISSGKFNCKENDKIYIASNMTLPSYFHDNKRVTKDVFLSQIYSSIEATPNAIYTQEQYNAYGTSQYNTGFSNGESAVINNPGSYSLYTREQYNNATSTGIATGQANVTSNPNQYGLYSSSQYNTYGNNQYNSGRTQGQNDVKNNPNNYSLYTQQQYQNNYTSGYNDGQDSIMDNLSYYNLYTEEQAQSLQQHGYSSGINEVRTHPNNYELYSTSQYVEYGEDQYQEGYIVGYDLGFEFGTQDTSNETYMMGFNDGKHNEELLHGNIGFLEGFFTNMSNIFSIEIFPGISIGLIISLPILLTLVVVVIKIFGA